MIAQGRGLMGRIADALGIDRPPPAHSAAALGQVAAGQQLCHEAEALMGSLREPLEILAAACHESGVMRLSAMPDPHRYPLFREGLLALLAADRAAAVLATSLIGQFMEAETELAELAEALGAGDPAQLNLARARGRFYYLSRMRLSVEDHPVLASLFGSPAGHPAGGSQQASRPEGPPRVRPDGGAGEVLGALSGRVVGLKRQVSKALGPSAGQAADPRQFAALLEQGQLLAGSLQLKMLILQAALDRALGKAGRTDPLLPLPARHTAEAVGVALAQDDAGIRGVKIALHRYHDVTLMLRRRNPEDHALLRSLLTDLGMLPLTLGGNAVLARLFPAA